MHAGNLKAGAATGYVLQKEVFLNIFRKFHWKKPVLESAFNKDAVLRPCNFIKEDSDTSVSEKFANFLKTIILKNICERLLLNII